MKKRLRKLKKQAKALPTRTKILAVSVLAAIIALTAININTPSTDIKPTTLICSTPAGAFKVTNETAKFSLENGTYTVDDGNLVVKVPQSSCVEIRNQ